MIHGKSWVNNHAHVLKNKSEYDLNYIFYSLVHKNIIPWINGTTRSKLNQSELREIKILVPPLKEQQEIAMILSSLDNNILEIQKELKHIEKLKKDLMQMLLIKGINHVEFNEITGILGKKFKIPQNWKHAKLSDITIKITDIDHNMPKKSKSGIPFISVGYVNSMPLRMRIIHKSKLIEYISKKSYDSYSSKFNVEKHDLVYTRLGSIGTACVVDTDEKFIASYSVALIKPRKNYIDSFFLGFFLNLDFVRKQAKYLTLGSANQNLHMSKIKSLQILIPPLKEQKEITSILFNVDELILKLQSELKYFQKLKKGLMQKLLTGQTRVPLSLMTRKNS